MAPTPLRSVAAFLAGCALVAACSADDGQGTGATGREEIDYEAIGLWDDGLCDEARDPLRIGLMTVFQSPVVSLEDQAVALEQAAAAFNARGGANGACIEVHTCDDRATVDQAVACVREIDEAGVVATDNDLGTAGNAEVSAAMADAGIPRVASNVTPDDWGDPNAFPLDASGTGALFLSPQGLIEEGVSDIGLIRVDLPLAAALSGLLGDLYAGTATFPVDIPVPAGTTDYSQFVLRVQESDAEGASIALGEQEAVQVARAAQSLGTDLLIGTSLGSFSHSSVGELDDFADQMVFVWSYAPATADIPAYAALRDDLAASGEEALQTENLKASPMRSWIGLYALLRMLRDAGMTAFTRESITELLESATNVPMLDMFGGENWTPNDDHPGAFARAGIDRWAIYRWRHDAESEFGGDFVETAAISFDEVLCGSPFGAPPPC